MIKFIASAGLVTVGAASLHAAYAPGLSPMETSKPWSISATLRGFYDDNYNNAPSSYSQSSGGFELSPSVRLNFPMDQTYVGLSYLYSLKYYFDREDDEADHLHEFTLKIDHRISERYKVSLDESFIYSVEPELIDANGGAITTLQRQNSDAIRNRAKVNLEAQLTELFGMGVSYQNTWYSYLDNEILEAELNRFEHLFDIHGSYQMQQHLRGLFGYKYQFFDYTSDKLLNPSLGPYDPVTNPNGSLTGNDRDSASHYFYLGAEHAFSSQLNGTVEIGAQYTSYDLSGDEWSPYADVRGTYTYLPGSFIQFGLSHTRNATDITGAGNTADITRDQETTTVFASLTHRITPRVTGSLLAQGQRSSYNGGSLDGDDDYILLLGINLEYKINNNWSAEAGYNFDRLDSDLGGRSFSRNRVYAGVRASF